MLLKEFYRESFWQKKQHSPF